MGMRYVPSGNKSCHTWEWVILYTSTVIEFAIHCTCMNELCPKWAWVMSHMGMSHIISYTSSKIICLFCKRALSYHTRESYHIIHVKCDETRHELHLCEWVMSQMGMSHVKHENESNSPLISPVWNYGNRRPQIPNSFADTQGSFADV